MMNKKHKQLIQDAFHDGWSPPFSGSIYEWANKHVILPPTLAVPGYFDVGISKYMVAPFDAIKNNEIRQVNILAAVQSGKTLISDITIPYLIANSAGSILSLTSTDEIASRQCESRLGPILKSTDEIKALMPKDRHAMRKRSFNFPHCNLVINGAKEAILQSLSIKCLIGDELFLWEDGYIAQAKLRTTAFPQNKKIIFTSTAGIIGDDWDLEFKRGTQFEWSWTCPSCSFIQPYYFNKQREDATWAGLTKQGTLSCFKCKHEVLDTPLNRRQLNDTGTYIKVSEGPADVHSYHWNCLAVINLSWSKIYADYKQAKNDLKYNGYMLPLQDFYMKNLAESWDENLSRVDVKAAVAQYDASLDWGKYRFMTVDVQQDKFYYGVYAWSENGEVRLLDFGDVVGYGDLRAIQSKWTIKDQHVGIDVGYNQTLIAGKALEHGHEGMIGKRKQWFSWIGLKGSKQQYFNHFIKKTGQTDKRVYSELGWIDPAQGVSKSVKKLPLYQWSNFSVKHIAAKLRDGKIGRFVVNDKITEDYTKQMNSEILKKEIDKKSGHSSWIWKAVREDNHQWDIFCMQIVMALLAGVFSTEYREEPETIETKK